jgi:hypothetical protein
LNDKSVSLDGTLFQKSGVISGGARCVKAFLEKQFVPWLWLPRVQNSICCPNSICPTRIPIPTSSLIEVWVVASDNNGAFTKKSGLWLPGGNFNLILVYYGIAVL